MSPRTESSSPTASDNDGGDDDGGGGGSSRREPISSRLLNASAVLIIELLNKQSYVNGRRHQALISIYSDH